MELHDFYCQITFQETIFGALKLPKYLVKLNQKAAQLI